VTPVLGTARLRLRPVREGDVDLFFEMLADPETMAYWSGDPLETREEAGAKVAQELEWAKGDASKTWIVETHAGEPVGRITLFAFAGLHRRAEVGLMSRRATWGRGFMGEALDAVVDHAFGTLGLRRLEADIDPDNARSLRLFEGRGFRREGVLRQRWLVRGEWRDSLMLARLRDDPV
jgi:ribosomal-protein-alanine N-acetyltransferase